MKDKGEQCIMTWSIVRKAKPYSPRTNRCNLCLWEKYYIMKADRLTGSQVLLTTGDRGPFRSLRNSSVKLSALEEYSLNKIG